MPDNYELRSEEVQEVLEKMPHWMTRWGTSLFFVLFLILLFVAGLIKYPDVNRYSAVINVVKAPAADAPTPYPPTEDSAASRPMSQSSSVYANLHLPQSDLPKISIGMKVSIKFPAYPESDYGVVLGEVSKVEYKADEKDFSLPVQVQLPADGITSKNRKIEYFTGLLAEVEITGGHTSVLSKMIPGHR